MGWNDREREDPYLPSEEDSYEGWLKYSEELRAADEQSGLTSQNIDPAALPTKPVPASLSPAREAMVKFLAKFTGVKQ